jgi:gamma-glutamyltranspeptidase/glutathione hydrolase
MKLFLVISFFYLFNFESVIFANERVVTSHPLATGVGEKILQDGGNAYDAAVAISATLSVIEPFASGLGGGGFWLMHDKDTNKHIFLDARETAPANIKMEMFLDEDGNHLKTISREGPLAAAIPGAPAALVYVAENYGSLPLSKVLKPAIKFAKEGFLVGERYVRGAEYKKDLLLKYPESSAIFLHNGNVPKPGWKLYQKDLAKTLKIIGESGHRGFYSGQLADKLVDSVEVYGGVWTHDDLHNFAVIKREPVKFSYKGHQLIAPGLPSSGGLMLEYIFSSLKSYDLSKLSPLETKHLMVELLKRSFYLRNASMGDPDFIYDTNFQNLKNEGFKELPEVDFTMATNPDDFPDIASMSEEGLSTTHFAVVDKFGNKVAVTQSINFWFGSGFVPKGTGVLLNNEMDDFIFTANETKKMLPNTMHPRKRMLSSMTPLIIESDQDYVILGTPGGKRIISMVLLAALDWIDGGNAKSMVTMPRYHHQFIPNHILFEENALSKAEQDELKNLGHEIKESNRLFGNMQIITWDAKNKELKKANDPRGLPKSNSRVY